MKIGIDISQLSYKNTGVANYLKNLVLELTALDTTNEYVLFYSSLRGKIDQEFIHTLRSSRVTVKTWKFPPSLLDILWNRLHLAPIEWFVGNVDVFITSDWTEPPAKKAKKVTFLYDLVVYKYPFDSTPTIVATQKRKLKWTKKESVAILCISEATKKDAIELLGIEESRLHVIYPGTTLLR